MTNSTGAPTSEEALLHDVVTAHHAVTVAKLWRHPGSVEHAELSMQAAVDRARAHDVPWGRIADALGIARGNAYRRYRPRVETADGRDRTRR